MNNKKIYLAEQEIKVKNNLADLYDTESKVLNDIRSLKLSITQKREQLEQLREKRENLQESYNYLKDSNGDDNWEKRKHEFELALDYAEGDKDSFVEKADIFIHELGEQITNLERKVEEQGEHAAQKTIDLLKELKVKRNELNEKIEEVKNDSSDTWKKVKHWFHEKSEHVKNYFTS
jgi:hypothetical protein